VPVRFKGKVQVSTPKGEFSLEDHQGKLILSIPSWGVLWDMARDRSGRFALGFVGVVPAVQKVPLPVFVRGRHLLDARLEQSERGEKRKPSLRFRLKPRAFLFGETLRSRG